MRFQLPSAFNLCPQWMSSRRIARRIVVGASLILCLLGRETCLAQDRDEPNYTKDSILLALKGLASDWEHVEVSTIAERFGVTVTEKERNTFGDLVVVKYRPPERLGFFSLGISTSWKLTEPKPRRASSFDVYLWRESVLTTRPNPVCITRQDVIEIFGPNWTGTLAPLAHGMRHAGPFDEIKYFKFHGMEFPLFTGKSGKVALIGFTFGHGYRCLGHVTMPFNRADASDTDAVK